MAKLMNTIAIYQAHGLWARYHGWRQFRHKNAFLFFAHCQAVHSFGLRHSLWVLFVDAQGQPIGNWVRLAPNRIRYCLRAFGVLECESLSIKKRHQLMVALQSPNWLSQTIHWRLTMFGQRHCGK